MKLVIYHNSPERMWVGNDIRPRLELRIILESPEKSYHESVRVDESN